MIFYKYITCGLLLLLLFNNVNASVTRYRLCGDSLTQFLSIMCVHGYNSKNLKEKKSVSLMDYDEEDNSIDIAGLQEPFMSLFMDKLYDNTNSLMVKIRRRRHYGVADECCKSTCTYAELSSYCKGTE